MNKELTPKQAIDLLEGDPIHTFRSTEFALVGADWERDKLEDKIRHCHAIFIGGPKCRANGHGLVIVDDNGPLFIKVHDQKLEALA